MALPLPIPKLSPPSASQLGTEHSIVPSPDRPHRRRSPRRLGLLVVLLALPPLAAVSAAVGTGPALETRLLGEMAAQGTNATTLYRLADLCHGSGAKGDKKAVERAEGYLQRLLALESTNAPALALLGSIYTMKGRDAFWPTTQLRLVREGNAYMDQAVQLAPLDLRTRITRVFNNAHMPDFLGRTEIVRADLAWLTEQAEKDPDRFTLSERQEIALHWGRQLKRMDRPEEARKAWETARLLAPTSSHAAELATELSRLR